MIERNVALGSLSCPNNGRFKKPIVRTDVLEKKKENLYHIQKKNVANYVLKKNILTKIDLWKTIKFVKLRRNGFCGAVYKYREETKK